MKCFLQLKPGINSFYYPATQFAFLNSAALGDAVLMISIFYSFIFMNMLYKIPRSSFQKEFRRERITLIYFQSMNVAFERCCWKGEDFPPHPGLWLHGVPGLWIKVLFCIGAGGEEIRNLGEFLLLLFWKFFCCNHLAEVQVHWGYLH